MVKRLSDAADALRAVVTAITSQPDTDPSFTVSMYARKWTVDVDIGDDVDDLILVSGFDLKAVLSQVAELLDARVGEAIPQARGDDDIALFLDLLATTKSRLSTFPLTFAYIPRSTVVPFQPWEVILDNAVGDMVVTGGSSASEALIRATADPGTFAD